MASHDAVPSSHNPEEELKISLRKMFADPLSIEAATSQLFERLLDTIIMGLAFEMHHLNRLGGTPVINEEDTKPFAIVENSESNIFGPQHDKAALYCCCQNPICNRTISASRVASHLHKCLGIECNSPPRLRRNANNSKDNAYGGTSDNDDDYWILGQDKSKLNKKFEGKKKKDKNGVKKLKTLKPVSDKNLNGKVANDYIKSIKYENVERKN